MCILAWWQYFVRPFLRHSRRCEALPLRVLWYLYCPLTLRKHLALAVRFAHDACSVLASCSLCGFGSVRGNSKKADCAKLTNGTSKSICACPNPPMRTQYQYPGRGKKRKRRGYPLILIKSENHHQDRSLCL
jgi:hypothetical protein